MTERIICTSKCTKCKYGTVNDNNKARIKVYCDRKKKEYWYGQMIPCDEKGK